MKNKVVLGGLLQSLLLFVACEKDTPTPTECGTLTCSVRQVCVTSSTPYRCVCREEYTGADCASCARGHTESDGRCVPTDVDCETNPGACGSRGTCTSLAPGVPDSCTCQTGYAGHVCQTCADGYQDNDRDGRCTPSCQTMTCSGAQTCSDTTGTARCECPGNRTGLNCDQCPAGWMLRPEDDVCFQTCTSSTSCGSRKTCDASQGICICRPEYAGETCEACAPGYQDNDKNGLCKPACATTNCTTGQLCDDSSGTARCACPPNRTGTNCQQCLSGWVLRPSDNTCIQTCAALNCGARRYCDETQGTPTCVCQAGYTGSDCASCAEGYLSDGAGQCIRSAPAGTTLLGAGKMDGADYLLAINPEAATAVALRPLSGLSGHRFSTDLAGRTIYTINNSGINLLDATTGQLTPVATVQSTATLAFGDGFLYTFGSLSPYLLKRVAPDTGAVSDIGPTNLPSSSGSAGLTWEAGGTLLYARPATSAASGPELYRIDPATAAVTMLGALAADPTRLRPADARLGLAFDAQGKLFLATRLGRAPEEIVSTHCRTLAAGLGLSGYEAAPLTSVEINYDGIGAGSTRLITSKNPSGKEIVAYASYGRRSIAKAILRIETANPDTFVCLSTYEEVLELQIPPALARWSGIALVGYRPTLTLAVEGAVPPVTAPTLHVRAPSGTVAPAFNGASGGYQFSRVYSSSEWQALTLPGHVTAWDTDANAPSVLLQIDLATRSAIRVLSFPGVELLPTVAPWAP